MAVKDDTVYCDVQMPVAQGRELLQLVLSVRCIKHTHSAPSDDCE